MSGAIRKLSNAAFGVYATLVLALALVPVATIATCVALGLVAALLGASPGVGWLGLFVGPILGITASLVIAHRIAVPPEDDPGRCERCDYSLDGLTSDRCPECGHLNASPPSDAANDPPS